MLFYISLVSIIVLFFGNYSVGGNKKPEILFWFGIIILILVLALRFDIGADYSQYYTNIMTAYKRQQNLNYEPLNKLLYTFSVPLESPAILIALYAILTLIIVGFAIKQNCSNTFFGILTYISLFYLSNFSTIRQGVSLAFVLYSYKYLRTYNYVRYYEIIMVAILFHYSAVVCLFFPFLYRCKNRYAFFIISFTVIAYFVCMKYIENVPILSKYAMYMAVTSSFGGGNVQKVFFWSLIFCSWIISYITGKKRNKTLMLCSFGCIFPILLGSHIGGRLAQFFYIYLCIAVPDILKNAGMVTKSLFCIVLVSWFLGYIFIATDGENISAFLPYRTIFEVDLSNPVFK